MGSEWVSVMEWWKWDNFRSSKDSVVRKRRLNSRTTELNAFAPESVDAKQEISFNGEHGKDEKRRIKNQKCSLKNYINLMKREKLLLVLRSRPFPFHLSGRENAERGMWESDEHRTKNFSQSLVMTFISKKKNERENRKNQSNGGKRKICCRAVLFFN